MAEPRPVRALGGTPWRGTDAALAHRVTLGELAEEHVPVLPELPDRGPGADAVGRSAALLAELSVDLQPHGWRVSPPSTVASGMDRRRARSYWQEDLQRWADTAGAEGVRPERLAVRVLGPLTLLGNLWLPGGERVLVDAGARRDVAAAYREGLGEALSALAATTGVARPTVLLDEPAAAAVLGGDLPTASGYRTVRSMPRDEARHLWREAFAALGAGEGTAVWVDPHAADAQVRDLALLLGEARPASEGDAPDPGLPAEGGVGVVLEVGALEAPAGSPSRQATTAVTPAAWEVAAGWSEAERPVALRPAADSGRAGTLDPAALLQTWDRLGLDPHRARALTLTTAGAHDAGVLARLRRTAAELGDRIAELGG
ncbi:hypothetical protein [Micrococcus sp.]|uniref:hypothetical protein n=1 Tax=Micrococcus sp. TaxID=1271 RepID=UPI002A91F04E|nr:hypothetical protein [Micrococcus sp.]MDY6055890.1 hypothetical protein [Micrococcus sp.]